MKDSVIITSPTLSDIPTLWKWGEENWQLWGDEKYKWFSKKTITRWVTTPKDDVLLVARVGDKPAGMCFMSVMRDWAFCFGLYVDKGYRTKGIGKQMLIRAESQMKAKGVGSYGLLVDTKNAKAVKFYKREGLFQGYKFYLMTKEL